MARIKNEVKVQRFPVFLPPSHIMASPIINIPHYSGTFVTVDEPTLTCHKHSKSIVYLNVNYWYHTFYGFGQMY